MGSPSSAHLKMLPFSYCLPNTLEHFSLAPYFNTSTCTIVNIHSRRGYNVKSPIISNRPYLNTSRRSNIFKSPPKTRHLTLLGYTFWVLGFGFRAAPKARGTRSICTRNPNPVSKTTRLAPNFFCNVSAMNVGAFGAILNFLIPASPVRGGGGGGGGGTGWH